MISRTQNQITSNWNETDKVAVSVVCATYNHELYIREALEGFLMQETNFPFEIIIHDDASTDKTAEIIREYASNYPAIIRPIFQSENQYSKGGFRPTAYAVQSAIGEYIALCEGDDYWKDSQKLQKQLDFLQKNDEYGMVHTNFDTYYQAENYLLKDTHSVLDINIKDRCSLDYWNLFGRELPTVKTPTTFLRLALVKEWYSVVPANTWLVGDFPLYFYLSLHSKIGYINHSTSVYRTAQGSASNVGADKKKQLQLRQTYADIRLHFFINYKLDKNNFKGSLVRDLNLLLDYCIITSNEGLLIEYLAVFNALGWNSDATQRSRIYIKSNRPMKKIILKQVEINIFISTYIPKISNPNFLFTVFQRKIR